MADAVVNLRIRLDDRTSASLRRIRVAARQLNTALNAGATAGPRATTQALNQTAASANRVAAAALRARAATQEFARSSARSLATLNLRLERLKRGFLGLGVGIGVGALAGGLIETADAAAQLQARLRIVADTQEDVVRVQTALFAISQETRTSFLENAKVFSRLSLATQSLGTSESDLLKIITGVNKAVQLSGSTAQEANAGIIQLTQGIASNRFQGDELRSVLENLIVVGESLATSLGTTIGGLRELGEAGELTRETLIPALIEINDLVEKRFAQLPITVGQASVKIRNALLNAFQGNETAPLVDSLNELALKLEDPTVQRNLAELAASVSRLAGSFIDLLPAIATAFDFLARSISTGQATVEFFAESLAELVDKGPAQFFKDQLDGSLNSAQNFADKVDAIWETIPVAADEASKKTAEAFAKADALIAAGTQKTAAAQLAASSARQARIKEELDSNKTGFSELDDRIRAVTESLEELNAPPERSDNEFIAQTQRLADVRRLDILLQEGQNQAAIELASSLRKEAKGLEDTSIKRFILASATRVQTAATEAEAAAIREDTAALEENKKALEAGKLSTDIPDRAEKLTAVDFAPVEPQVALGQTALEGEPVEDLQARLEIARELDRLRADDGVAEQGPPIEPVPIETVDNVQAIAAAVVETKLATEEPIILTTNLPEVTTEVEASTSAWDALTSAILRADAALRASRAPPRPTANVSIGNRGQQGGRLPGFGGGDAVPAMLERGEFVVRKESTQKNLGLLNAINAGNTKLSKFTKVQKFRDGGPVGFESSISDAGGVTNRTPVTIVLPSGDSLNLQEGTDSVETIKETMRRESLKRGRRVNNV